MPPKKSRKVTKRYNRQNKRRTRKNKKALALLTHNFVERFEETIRLDASIVNTAGNLTNTVSKKFSFDMITQHPSYSELFDEYKINKVVATFRWSPSRIVRATNNYYAPRMAPLLFFKVDHNDSSADTLVELKKSMKTHYKTIKYDEPFTIQFKPASQTMVDANIGNTFTPTWNRWITTQVLDVEHLGLKLQVQVPIEVDTGTIDAGQIDIEYKMYFSMKCNE